MTEDAQLVRRAGLPATIEQARAGLRPVAARPKDFLEATPDSAGPGRPPVASAAPKIDPRQLDELVDQVVERIEQRVVDELERRGRFGALGGM
ncbi:MAG: hypothetical protein EPN43_05130 [Jatrophihabitans sp.]|nr:MAG: hypothetical protein EPN43_05130 [Jatrophihabitans sp.]